MVLGQPGAGKSTFLRRIGLAALRGEYGHKCVPVFIELKRFTTQDIDLEKVIASELKACGFPKPEASTTKLLDQGKLLLLLDGLDEVPNAQLDLAIQQIKDFVDRYSKNRFIASCRIAAYRNYFTRFSDVIMADFDDEQIQQFIQNWFSTTQDRQFDVAKRCWELLKQPEYQSAKELAQTPLLLTFLCLVFDDSQTFPKNRAVLYGEALDVLLKKWAAEKRVQRNPIYQDLTYALEEMMLAELAYQGFQSKHLFFSKRNVVAQIRDFLANNLNAPKHLDGDVILEAIQVQQGILVERATNVLSFSHLTIQEYLTAKHIVDHNLINLLIDHHIADGKWREIILLVAGLSRGSADLLLQQMDTVARQRLNSDKIQALIQWSDQIIDRSNDTYKPAAKRSIALLAALATDLDRALDRAGDRNRARSLACVVDRALVSALDLNLSPVLARIFASTFDRSLDIDDRALDRALDRAQTLDKKQLLRINFSALIMQLNDLKSQVPKVDSPGDVKQRFALNLQKVWLDAWGLDARWVDLSRREVQAFDEYFYINELMVRCKEAAVRVSPQVWQDIELQMLTTSSSKSAEIHEAKG
jgi:predicted NACHT family NTPase